MLPLILEIQRKTAVIRATGSYTAQVEADRADFQADLFRAASMNVLDFAAPPLDSPV